MNFSYDDLVETLLIPISYLFNPRQRVYIPYLCTSFIVAIFVTIYEERKEKGVGGPGLLARVMGRIFPKSVYLHRSAVADYCYFYSNTIFYALLSAPSLFSLSTISSTVFRGLSSIFGEHQQSGPAPFYISLLYSVMVVLAFDLALFLAHMIQHMVPFLWNFHKVHHSAEVLTPISVYRMHPIDDMLSFLFTGFLSGVADGCFRYFIAWNVPQVLIVGLNFVLFLFYVMSYHLRHSDIWFSYGPRWSKIFISPAQHQIHHSTARKHWDKNFGFIFAFWDGWFGSLYIPKEKESIKFGIGDGSEAEYSNFLMLYWIPFRDSFRMIARRRQKAARRNSEAELGASPKSGKENEFT